MTNFKRSLLLKAYKIFDLSAMFFAFAVASLVSATVNSPIFRLSEFLAMRIKLQNFVLLLLLFISWLLIFQLLDTYRSRRLEGTIQEIFDLLKATTLATSLLLAASFTFSISLMSQSFLIAFWAVSSFLLIASRIVLRIALKKIRLKGHNIRHIVIIGTGERAQKLAKKLSQAPELGYHILGFIDDHWEGLEEFNYTGWKLLTDLNGFHELLNQQVIDEVFIALPLKSYYDRISTIINLCEEQGIIIRFISNLFDLRIAKSYIDSLEDTPILTLQSSPIEHWSFMLKRCIDVLVSSILLSLFAPLFLLVAILIKIDSQGSIFFLQERVGYNKRRFKLIKFRSMVQDAEKMQDELQSQNEASGPVFKIKNDPRSTRIGKWLRRMSIDELPQLINVFIGDMSLVGPRPLPFCDYEGFNQNWHRRRFSVRPGITCLWQVNGRSDIPFEKWMELDMEYIDNWSLWLDMKILTKTIPAVILGSGAA
jgi:exopolysaccharide biosynthesis polyprenyl glycosylphosphotransferase